MEPNLVKISPGETQSWWSSLLVELYPDGGAHFGISGICVVSGWHQGVSGWFQGGVSQGGTMVVSGRLWLLC